MTDQEMIQEKIGEAPGLEKAAPKPVEDLDSRGLLKPEQMKKLSKMKEEASQQEEEMQDLVKGLVESDGFDQEEIDEKADETADKPQR
jgi:Spy/CpxP family protein refolding chaperone